MIVYLVYVFDDQWLFCLVAMAILNLKKKRNLLNDNSSKTAEAVGLLFCTNVAWLRTIPSSEKFCGLPLGLVAIATESSRRLIMGKWLNCTFSITIEVMWAIFGSYDHLMIVYPVHMFYDWWPFCLLPWQHSILKKGLSLVSK